MALSVMNHHELTNYVSYRPAQITRSSPSPGRTSSASNLKNGRPANPLSRSPHTHPCDNMSIARKNIILKWQAAPLAIKRSSRLRETGRRQEGDRERQEGDSYLLCLPWQSNVPQDCATCHSSAFGARGLMSRAIARRPAIHLLLLLLLLLVTTTTTTTSYYYYYYYYYYY